MANRISVMDDIHATVAPTVGETTSTGTRFRILRPHAKGGLGEVFVAADEELHREVALKQMQDRAAHDPASRARFVLEAEITGGLEHPGIVPVYGLGAYADGKPFYAMRFIRGDTLQEAIARFHRKTSTDLTDYTDEKKSGQKSADFDGVSFRKLLSRFIDVCNAIQYAHDRGVLHRDLKPGNIMLGPYGETLVVDWGLAKAIGQLGEPRASVTGVSLPEPILIPQSGSGVAETQAGSAIGTPHYMSPEQAAGRVDLLGPASDVYSLGATLYSLLTGVAPLDDADLGTLLRKAERADFPKPRARDPRIPPALEAICLKAMALWTQDRYASSRHLAEDVERWLANEPVRAWPEPWTMKARRWMGKHRTVVSSAAAAIFVTLIAGVLGVIWYHQEEARLGTELALRVDAISDALDHARKSRDELHSILRKPGGVSELLNQPDRWDAHIQMAQNALAPGSLLLRSSTENVSAQLAHEVKALDKLLMQDAADRALAVRLEQIRTDRALKIEGRADHAPGSYKQAFDDAGMRVLGSAELHRSPIKEQLAATLDDWALAAAINDNNQLVHRLLESSRTIDPDPNFGDKLRQPQLWNNAASLTKIAREANPGECSARTARVLALLLKMNDVDPVSWLVRAHEVCPTDFWLNFELGNNVKNGQEAVGYFRAAVGIRPTGSAAWMSLGAALRKQGNLQGAEAAFKKAMSIEPTLRLTVHGP